MAHAVPGCGPARSRSLSGTIPTELGRLAALGTLSLHDNGLAGAIPSWLGAAVALLNVDLSNNALHGSVPSALLTRAAENVAVRPRADGGGGKNPKTLKTLNPKTLKS